MMRYLLIPAVALGMLVAGCDEPETGPCRPDSCEKGYFCVNAVCLDGTLDYDGDGLITQLELQWSLDPLNADSDGDGRPDRQEWGDGPVPLDTDGDGIPDALEPWNLDSDGDCVPDHLDPDAEETPLSVMTSVVCPSLGVCAQHIDGMDVACRDGTPHCVMPEGSTGIQALETWCDGGDNDCDGVVDELIWLDALRLGEECPGVGECRGGIVECSSGTRGAICSSMPGGSQSQASPEACDGLDNNCDGATDEGLLFGGIPLGEACVGWGLCGAGLVECHPSSGEAICSTMRGGAEDQSADEVCDGFDNDCDGIVDQGLFMDSIDLCPTSGVCAQHPALLRSTCILGLWQCDPSLVPGYEAGTELSCDGLDNDCDGLVDEDFILLDYDGQQKIIEESCGTGACADGWVVCAPDGRGIACSTAHLRSEEGCDGLDNDCDGLTDEGQTYQGNALGSPCTGVGACGAGVVQCSPASRKATCSTNPDGMDSEAHPEACDGLDNNCNGLTDEGLTGVVPCSALGVCEDAVAVAQCLYGQWVCNYGFLPNWQADETSCDGLDNDCDGFVDERLAKSMLLATASHRTGSPPARSGSARIFARHGTDRWIVGGQVHPFPYLGVRPHVGDLWHFESLTGRWRTAEDIGLSGRRDAAGAELPGGDLVIVGGQSQSGVLADAWRVGPSAADIAVLWPPGTITGRYGHLVVPVQSGGTLLLVGGRGDGDIWLDSVLVPVDGSPGVSVPEIPWMVHSASCAMDDGDVVVLGGPGPGGSGGGLFHVDVELGAVEPLPGAGGPGPRLRCGLVCLSDRIIALGGVDEAGQALADVWAYDLATGQWGVLPSLPEPLSDVVAVDKGGVEVLWGIRADGTALASMVRWVSAADEGWIVEEQVPPLAAASGTVDMLRRQLCVLGGFVSGTTGPVPNHQYFCLDERGLLVEKGELPDSDPVLFSLATWDPYRDRMLVLGGSHFPPGGEPQFLSPVCRYLSLDRGSSSWSSFAPCNAGPGAVSAPAAAVRWKDMTWWIQGGVTPGGVSTSLWQFSFITGEWTVWQFPTSLPARYGHMMGFLEGEDHLILAGGAGAGSSVTVVDLQNLDWTTVATQPFVEHSFRPVFLEAQSRTLVWVGHSETFAAQLAAGQDSLPLQPLFSSAGTGLLATQWVSPWSRQGILFGGIDRFGLSVSHWTEITPGCLP